MKCAEVENNSTGSDASFMLARFWLNRCLERHDLCSRLRLSQPFIPSRLLNVSAGKVRLIETKKELIAEADKRFIALSHCWGRVQIITTTRGSLESRLKGIQTDQLSQTFLDAITVTRKLSYRYLWIDSLCIIQDDSADWEKEAAQMCNVYQFAELTISAAHASGGNIGCFRKRDGILQLPFILNFPITEAGKRTESTLQAIFTSHSQSEGIQDPHPPLYGRAWVLQEQLLSPRMLIFDGEQLKWDCLCMHGSERSPSGGGRRMHHEIVKSGIFNSEDFFYRPDYDNLHLHFLWYQVVADYTLRGMTKPLDRLAAIAGIANAITTKTTNQYLAGLWRDQLLIGLLWNIPHDVSEYGPEIHSFDMDRYERIRHTVPIAPSWSWGSVTVPVRFLYFQDAGRLQHLCKIQEVNVTGTAVCQSGRLQILGHIRVTYVNSIYPYTIRQAARKYAHMQYPNRPGIPERMTHCGRSFFPHRYFLCSRKLSKKESDWQLVCGYWRPDEVLDPSTEITFIAIGQRNLNNSMRASVSHTIRDPLEVFTLGLVPTGRAANEYRRVGCGLWSACAWYGFSCISREEEDRWYTTNSWGWWLYWTLIEKVWGKAAVGGLKVQHSGHENPITAVGSPRRRCITT